MPITTLFTAGLIQLIYNFKTQVEFKAIDIWIAAKKSFFRLLALIFLATLGLFIVGVGGIIAYYYSTYYPLPSYSIIVLCVFIAVFIMIIFPILEIELVIYSEPFFRGLVKGIRLTVRNIIRVFIFSFILTIIHLSVTALVIASNIIPKRILLEPNILTIKGILSSLNNPIYIIIGLIINVIYLPFWTSVMVILFHRITTININNE